MTNKRENTNFVDFGTYRAGEADILKKELEKIINEGDFDSLIGQIENDFFDCKEQIYNLQNEYSKWELAKDVSSFANLNGGFVLIGPKTGDSRTHFGEEVKTINYIDKSLINPDQYNSIINDWIFPKIDGVQVEWKIKENNKGILVIKIPSQKENQKPFLIRGIPGRAMNDVIFFGYCKRKQDKSEHLKIGDIHKVVRDGLIYDKNIENRFDNLKSIMLSLLKKRKEEEQRNKDKKYN